MGAVTYPLEQLKIIKAKRFEQAQKTLEEKKEKLRQEEKRLKEKIAERDEMKAHHLSKLNQLRTALDEGTTSDKIQQMKLYLDLVKEKLLQKEKRVEDQKKNVEHAEKEVIKARKDLMQKEKELEKLNIHKKHWEKELQFIESQQEEKILDEIGSMRHSRLKKEAE